MICTALYVMLLTQENPLRGQVGGGWALEIETVLGLVKWNRAILGVKKLRFSGPNPLPLAQVMDLLASNQKH